MSDDMITWLRGVLDEDERAARYAMFDGATGVWSEKPSSGVLTLEGVSGLDGLVPIGDLRLARHMELHDPAAVLADIAAKRAILDLHDTAEFARIVNGVPEVVAICEYDTGDGPLVEAPCDTLRLLASAYAERPGYREEWGPDAGGNGMSTDRTPGYWKDSTLAHPMCAACSGVPWLPGQFAVIPREHIEARHPELVGRPS